MTNGSYAMNGSSTTIVARATSPHPAAISIIRLSGPQSHTIAKFVAGKVTTTRQAELVSLKDKDGKTLDQGLQIIFHAPHSYTGENMVEWHCHGSVLLGNILLETAIAFGAQMAEPGEFTKRAFFNDKMDLHQAQAVAGIIDATSKRQMHLAASSLAGHFSQLLAKLSKQLDWLRSQIEAHLDFSDEHINPANLQKMTAVIADLHEKLSTLVTQANNNLTYAHCPKVLLLGEPNTGKSSIFNCLLGEKRALVSEQAGTTRDLLREHLRCGDINIRLCDSAGIRHSNNTIEQAGVTLTFEQFTEADYVLVVFDANQAMPIQLVQQLQDRLALIPNQLPEQSTIDSKRICLVANKVDLLQQQPKLTNYLIAGNSLPCIWLSALHNRGIDLLRQWLEKEIAHEQIPEQGDAFLIGQHHAHALTQAQNDLAAATNLLSEQSLELCAEHLRVARLAIDQLTGRSANDTLLDSIFSQFCIGK